MIDNIVEEIRDLLDRYTSDESGQHSRDKFEEMSDINFIQLLVNTLCNEEGKHIDDWREDFETDLIINFDYSNY